MSYIGTYDGTIFYNPANRYCIINVKTADQSIPSQARSTRQYRDHLIRFVAVGYELPRTDAVQIELDGEWINSKHGQQLQIEQWHEIVPRTADGWQKAPDLKKQKHYTAVWALEARKMKKAGKRTAPCWMLT